MLPCWFSPTFTQTSPACPSVDRNRERRGLRLSSVAPHWRFFLSTGASVKAARLSPLSPTLFKIYYKLWDKSPRWADHVTKRFCFPLSKEAMQSRRNGWTANEVVESGVKHNLSRVPCGLLGFKLFMQLLAYVQHVHSGRKERHLTY